MAATLNASDHSVIHIHPSLLIQTIVAERDLRCLDQRLLVDVVEVVRQLSRSLQRDILSLSLADVVLHETLQTRAVTQRVVLPSVDLLLARVLSPLRPLMVLGNRLADLRVSIEHASDDHATLLGLDHREVAFLLLVVRNHTETVSDGV